MHEGLPFESDLILIGDSPVMENIVNKFEVDLNYTGDGWTNLPPSY